MYYPCSENKGADQLRGHREADLRLCFRISKNPVFSRRGSFCFQTTKDHMYNVLLFADGGWMIDQTQVSILNRSCKVVSKFFNPHTCILIGLVHPYQREKCIDRFGVCSHGSCMKKSYFE